MTKIERLGKAVSVARSALRALYESSLTTDRARLAIKEYERDINAVLNPVKYEDVPVVRYVCLACGSIYREEDLHMVEDNQCGACGEELAKLTGTVRREKVVSVEHFAFASVTGEDFGPTGTIKVQMNDYNDAYRLRNKRISITWQEDPPK
jgi:DNA-directed RNA polymerase subunit RPC12/RpoP